MESRYYSYNQYLQETFGERVHRLSLDAGFNCPNLDGRLSTQGCTFCNNRAFSRYTKTKNRSIKEQIEESMLFARNRYNAKKFIAYFQAFSNTYAGLKTLQKRYSIIKNFKNIVGIAISTRPDCINQEKLSLLSEFSQKYRVYIEYGLQSIHATTLKKINRNHNLQSFLDALNLTKKYKKIHPAAHIILGLPGETRKEMLETAKFLAQTPLWGIKIHCFHVVKNTTIQKEYQKEKIKLLSQEEYLNIAADFLRYTSPKTVILRLISDASPQELIAPKWLNQKNKALNQLNKLLEERNIRQGDRLTPREN